MSLPEQPNLDFPALLASLRETRPAPDRLRELLDRHSPAITHAVLLHLERRLLDEDGPGLASLLPADLNALPLETQTLLARLYRLVPAGVPLPNWRFAALPPVAEVAWLQTALLRDTEAAVSSASPLLHAALAGLDWQAVTAPEQLLAALAARAEPSLQELACEQIERCLHDSTLLPSTARELLLALLAAPAPAVVEAALLRLGQPWAVCFPCPERTLASLLSRGGGVARAALDVLARWPGAADRLAAVLAGEDGDRYLHRHALALLGRAGGKEHVQLALDIAAADPLFFGGAVLGCVRDLTRRGVPWSAVGVEPLFLLFLRCPSLSVADTAEVVGPRWTQWLAALDGLPAGDPSWPRQTALLERAGRTEVNAYLLALLARQDCAPLHAAALFALGRLGCRPAEPLALALLDRIPEAAVFALERVGGEATCHALVERLEIAVPSSLSRPVALRLLLALSERTDLVLDLVAPEEIPPEAIARLGAPLGERTLDVLSALAHRTGHPARLQAIGQLGAVGGADALPVLHDLFLADEEIRTAGQAAARAIGRRLFALGKARPACLLDARSAEEAAEYVLADTILEALDRTGRDEDQTALLLEQLSELHHPRLASRVRPWLRKGGIHIQKHVLRCIGRTGDPHLSTWLLPFAAGADPFTARPALEALGRMHATWASEVLAAALDHPNMNVKKTAAEALRSAGGPAVVPVLLGWLSKHDNPGLRTDLVQALGAILGGAYAATVLAALSNTVNPREIELLLAALDRYLSRAAVVQAVRQRVSWAGPLLEALRAGTLRLASGDWPSLERELRRRGLADALPEASGPTAGEEIENALRSLDGDDAALERALGVLHDRVLAPVHVRALRVRLPYLLERLADAGDRLRQALLDLIERLLDQFEEAERLAVAIALRQALDLDRLPLDRALRLLRRCSALLSPDEVRRTLALPDADLRGWALAQMLNEGVLSAEELTALLVSPRWIQQRDALLEYGLRLGLNDVLLSAALNARPPFLGELRRRWRFRPDSVLADLLFEKLSHCPEAARGELLSWLADLDDIRVDAMLLQHLSSGVSADRERAVARLRQRPAQFLGDTLLGLMRSPSSEETRRAAARVLLSWPHGPYREQALDAYLRGELGGPLPELRLDARDLARTQDVGGDEKSLSRLAELIGQAAAAPRERAIALLELWERATGLARESVRSSLPLLPVEQVLPLLLAKLGPGRWGLLDLLGHTTRVDGVLVAFLRVGDDRIVAGLLGLFERWAAVGFLTGPGLTEALIEIVPRQADAGSVALLGRLSDWSAPKGARLLIPCLSKLLERDSVARPALAALLEGLRVLPPEVQARELTAVRADSARPAIVARLAELHLETPAATAHLAPAWRESVRQRLLELARGHAPEPARQALTALAEEADMLLPEVLEEALDHPHSRVRALAHRLLRQAVRPERYLEATRRLLHDRVPELRRLAVRVLAFRGYAAATREIALLLYDRDKGMDRVARAGLLVLGPLALPALRRLLSRARPDRRPPLQEVIAAIELSSGAERN